MSPVLRDNPLRIAIVTGVMRAIESLALTDSALVPTGSEFDVLPWIIGAVVVLLLGGILLFLMNRKKDQDVDDEVEAGAAAASARGSRAPAHEAHDSKAEPLSRAELDEGSAGPDEGPDLIDDSWMKKR